MLINMLEAPYLYPHLEPHPISASSCVLTGQRKNKIKAIKQNYYDIL